MTNHTPATVADAERVAFEKAMNAARFLPCELDFAMTKSPSGRDEYANTHLESCWVGWQARAAAPQIDAPTAPDVAKDAERLTDADIQSIWRTMPGGPAGWLKSFGFIQFARAIEGALVDDTDAVIPASPIFAPGTIVRKKSGSQWEGTIVGAYSTALTPEGYAVESSTHRGSVQIYPVGALEVVKP